MAKLNFGGVEENVVTREEFPLAKAQQVLKNETVAVIGYGVQGPGQALNQKDNGINVIVGQRKNSKTWDKAVRDGFARRYAGQADRFRKELGEWYGEDKAKNFKYCEAFEICEYGKQPDKAELERLFPFHK